MIFFLLMKMYMKLLCIKGHLVFKLHYKYFTPKKKKSLSESIISFVDQIVHLKFQVFENGLVLPKLV